MWSMLEYGSLSAFFKVFIKKILQICFHFFFSKGSFVQFDMQGIARLRETKIRNEERKKINGEEKCFN